MNETDRIFFIRSTTVPRLRGRNLIQATPQ